MLDEESAVYESTGGSLAAKVATTILAGLGTYWLWLGSCYLAKPYLVIEAFAPSLIAAALGATCVALAGRLFHNIHRAWICLYPGYLEGIVSLGWFGKSVHVRAEYAKVSLPVAHAYSDRLAGVIRISGTRYIVYCHTPELLRRVLRTRLRTTTTT